MAWVAGRHFAYGAGRRPYLIYAQSDFLPGRDF